MLQAVIFDMDGVLVDSEPLHYATTLEVLARRGRTLDRAAYDACRGLAEVPFFAHLTRMLDLDEDPLALARERQRAWFSVATREALVPCEGALECLLSLRAEGFSLALASSATRPQVEVVVEALGLRRCLSAVVSADDVVEAKPAPDLFLEAARRLAVPAPACCVIEDAVLGVVAARRAGMSAIAVVEEGSDREHREAGALACIRTLHELTADALAGWLG